MRSQIRSQHFFFFFFFSSFVAPLDINLDNEITNHGMTELFCANPREVREATSAVGRASSSNSRLPSQLLTAPTPSDINLDNEITNQGMTELFCANPREVREATSAVGQASSSNSRLPSQVLTAPTPLDINLDNEITNQVTTLIFFSFFFFFFLFFFCSSIGHQFGQ